MDYHSFRIFAESWNVAYRKRISNRVLEASDGSFTIIKNSFKYWAADPFVFEDGEDVYVFAELYDYTKKRGIIGYCRLNDKKCKWTPVITEPYHLSFPFLFRSQKDIYLLPESNQSSSLYLYRAVRFPDIWEKESILWRNVRFADTTPFLAFERWMAFTYDLDMQCLRLLVFSEGKDIVIDSSFPELKRPAGYINVKEGIRAAQYSMGEYGKGLVFYRFFLGKDLSFHEHEIRRVFPSELSVSKKIYLDGMHTYQSSEHYEVIDLKTRRFNPLNFLVRLLSKLKVF